MQNAERSVNFRSLDSQHIVVWYLTIQSSKHVKRKSAKSTWFCQWPKTERFSTRRCSNCIEKWFYSDLRTSWDRKNCYCDIYCKKSLTEVRVDRNWWNWTSRENHHENNGLCTFELCDGSSRIVSEKCWLQRAKSIFEKNGIFAD